MKILFVTSTRIGDAVLSTCLLKHLVDSYPQASITVACGPLPASLFEAVPGVARVIPLRKQPFAGHWMLLWSKVMGTSWDIVVDLRASALAWTLRARQRKTLKTSDKGDSVHRVEELSRFFDLPSPADPKLWLSETAERRAASIFPENTPVIGLGVTANWLPKIWPAQNFVDLAERLTSSAGKFASAQIAVFGAKEERALAQPVLDGLPTNHCIDLVGQSELPTIAACLARCAIFIGNDSGLMHMAAAVKTPTVGLFGPSPALRYAPWGAHCVAVESSESYTYLVNAPNFDHRATENLMAGLSVDAVEQAALGLCARIAETSNG